MGDANSIGFIGLGAMGFGMACNMLQAGLPVVGYDAVLAARERFAKAGGRIATSAAAAAQDRTLLVLMVVDDKQVDSVLFEHGAAAALMPGATVMLCATIAPTATRAIAARLAKGGQHLLDAPVSGGAVGADAGTLSVMASGPAAAFERAAATLAAISKTVHRLGEAPGLGSTYKVVHQLAAGVNLVAAAEVMVMGQRAGCDPDTLVRVISSSAGQSWMFDDRVPRMLQDQPRVASAVDILLKDLDLVLDTGNANQVPLPLAAAARQMMVAAAALGHGRDDDSAVVKAYEALTPVR
jgi:3-hydroxyisobutyrate dehydrogenase